MLPGALFLALLNPLCGRILDKRGPYLLSLAGLVLLGGATFGLSFIGIDTPLATVVILYAFRTLGVVALLQPLQTWAVNSVESKFISPWDSPHEYGAPGGRFHHQRPFGNSHVPFLPGTMGI